ncbi:B-cell receptor-associated protein 29 [Orchesella cincta]|uniref:Endoplasmic reticulum transmembrane protein n=1 Tax=Orchesella cincta TaxID=48709 RepID=A0A1D2N0I5_ORCCI|nr:B-cell receptor-associated protein 29 [Orchesella cincta]
MGYWWYGTSWFVHFQVIVVLLILSPFARPKFWANILGCRIIGFINDKLWNIYLMIGTPSLLVFLDSIRELHKHSTIDYDLYGDPITRKDARIAMLQAQRNYYISGAAVILCMIVPRLLSILRENGDLSIRSDATKSAFKSFKRLINVIDLESEIERAEVQHGIQSGGTRNQTSISRALISAMQKELERLAKEGVNLNSPVDYRRQLQLEQAELEQLFREYEQHRHGELGRSRPQPQSESWNSPRARTDYNNNNINNNRAFQFAQRQPQPRFGLF